MQHSQLEKKVDLLRQEKKKLRDDWVLLMRHVEDLKVLCKNQEENGDVKTQQQQVGQANQSGYGLAPFALLTALCPPPTCAFTPT